MINLSHQFIKKIELIDNLTSICLSFCESFRFVSLLVRVSVFFSYHLFLSMKVMLASIMDSRLENLSLSVDEEEELVLDTGEDGSTTQSFDLCLIGRFLNDRMINFNAMKHRLASVWRPGKGICIKEINKQLFLFQFFHIVDLKRVLESMDF